MSDIKQTILTKLQKLEELINTNHESGDDLFPKHWLILLTVKDTLNKKGEVPRACLESMNKIWKINKAIEKAGSSAQFETEIWTQLAKLDPPDAIKLFKESFVKDDGTEFSLSEAKNLIADK